MDKENFFQEYKGVVVAISAAAILGIVLLLSSAFSSKQIAMRVVAGAAGKTFKAGESYTIGWSAKNVKRVGIVLFDGTKPLQWIAQDYPAREGKFVWESYPYLNGGANYRFAVFEYPWRKGNPIAYSPDAIEVVGQKYVSCNDYSVQYSWPFLPDSYPNIHRVFITSAIYPATFDGLEGADEKCKKEAEKNSYPGTYVAFIGTDKISASERIAKDGIFVEAEPIGTLAEGRTCNRMVAENLQKLLDKTRMNKNMAQVQLSETFYKRLGDVWFGRRTQSTDTKCLAVPVSGVIGAFSNTYTCQDWSIGKKQVYTGTVPAEADLPKCYDSEGKSVKANYYAAIASGFDEQGGYALVGSTCESSHRLMCVEQ